MSSFEEDSGLELSDLWDFCDSSTHGGTALLNWDIDALAEAVEYRHFVGDLFLLKDKDGGCWLYDKWHLAEVLEDQER